MNSNNMNTKFTVIRFINFFYLISCSNVALIKKNCRLSGSPFRAKVSTSLEYQQDAFWAMNERERIDVLKYVTVTCVLVQISPIMCKMHG